MRILVAILLACALGGCADTQAYLAVEGLHTSHLSQHFESPSTNYGYDAVGAAFRIEKTGSGPFASLIEAYVLERRWARAGLTGAGALLGPSELTEIKIGYRFRVW